MNYRRLSSGELTARVPLRPIETALRVYNSESLSSAVRWAFTDDVTRAALNVASPSLYSDLIAHLDNNKSVSERVLWKALQYVVRMATRCTPFGLFSAVASVPTSDTTTLSIDSTQRKAYTRVDMGVVERLVSDLEFDRETRGNVFVFTSDYIKPCGEVCVVYRNSLTAPATQSQVLQRTRVIDAISDYCQTGITIDELLQHLERHLQIDQIMANEAVDILLKSGFLVSDLRSIVTRFDASSVLERYAATSSARAQAVRDLTARLSIVNNSPVIEHRPSQYQAIREAIGTAFGPSGYTFQTDSIVAVSGAVSVEIVNEAIFYAEAMLQSRLPLTFSSHAKRFVEKYEGEVLVPLMELEGDPILEDLTSPGKRTTTHGFTPAGNTQLLRLILEAISRRTEVRLTKTDLTAMFAPYAHDELPNAIEVGFQIAAQSLNELNHGNYVLAPAAYVGSQGIGKCVGRFLHLLPNRREDLRRWYKAADERLPFVTAELLFIPNLPRSGNVCASERVLDYDIQVGVHDLSAGTTRIPLSDLYVGVRKDQFFLWSQSLERDVVPYRNDNLAVVGSGSTIVSFLAILAMDGFRSCQNFCLGDADKLPHVPRIVVDRVILSPARWRLRANDMPANHAEVCAWQERDAVPRFVLVSQFGDQKLFIDLDSEIGRGMLLAIAKRGRGQDLVVEEAIGLANPWLSGTDGLYNAEFVAQLELIPKSQPVEAIRSRRYFSVGERARTPRDGWLYFKIWCDEAVQSYILRTVVHELVTELNVHGVEKWFFIRYADPRPHIRLRFFLEGQSESQLCASIIWERLSLALRNGLVVDIGQATYLRELDRYGGVRSIEMAEAIFALDSNLVIESLRDLDERAKKFEKSVEQAATILSALVPDRELPSWKKLTSEFNRKLDKDDWKHIREIQTSPSQSKKYTTLSGKLGEIREALLVVLPASILAEQYMRFVNSILHMHFNRWGVSSTDERRAMIILWHLVAGRLARGYSESERGISEVRSAPREPV